MSDYFGRLLGLAGANVVRPRLPGLFEPVNALPEDEQPMPARMSGPTAEPDAPAATVVSLTSKTAPRDPVDDKPQPRRETTTVRVVRDPVRELAVPETVAAPAGRAVAESPVRVLPLARRGPAEPARVAPIATIGQPVRPPAGLPTQHPAGAAPSVPAPDAEPAHQLTNVHRITNSGTEHNVTNQVFASRVNQVTHQHQHQQQRREKAESAPESEPVIRVNIGRIEVTAAAPPATPARRASRPRSATQSLASYLAERDGGRA